MSAIDKLTEQVLAAIKAAVLGRKSGDIPVEASRLLLAEICGCLPAPEGCEDRSAQVVSMAMHMDMDAATPDMHGPYRGGDIRMMDSDNSAELVDTLNRRRQELLDSLADRLVHAAVREIKDIAGKYKIMVLDMRLGSATEAYTMRLWTYTGVLYVVEQHRGVQ